MNTKSEIKTLDTSATLFNFLQALDFADRAETTRFNETEKALGLLKLLRGQYSTLQHGNAKAKPKAGELPNSIYVPVIQSLYDAKQKIALNESKEFTLRFDSYRDFQVKSLKFYIETGELFNRKKETLQERALIAIDKLEKKLAAEKAKLDKAKQDAEKAKVKADKAATDKAATTAKVEVIINDVLEVFDTNPSGADAIKEELQETITAAEFLQKHAIETDKTAQTEKVQAEKAQAVAEKSVDTVAKQLEKAKAKLSAPKAESKPDLSNVEFSRDCRAEMTDVLNTLVNDYSDVELLCLASLINKRFK